MIHAHTLSFLYKKGRGVMPVATQVYKNRSLWSLNYTELGWLRWTHLHTEFGTRLTEISKLTQMFTTGKLQISSVRIRVSHHFYLCLFFFYYLLLLSIKQQCIPFSKGSSGQQRATRWRSRSAGGGGSEPRPSGWNPMMLAAWPPRGITSIA